MGRLPAVYGGSRCPLPPKSYIGPFLADSSLHTTKFSSDSTRLLPGRIQDDDEINDGGEVIKKGEWHQSQSFGRDDLLLVAKVADLCHTWIFRRIQDQSREQSF